MAHRHGIPARLSEAELGELLDNPRPGWSSPGQTGQASGRLVQLTCAVCGFSGAARPKKWWPDFTYVCCAHHQARDIPRRRRARAQCV